MTNGTFIEFLDYDEEAYVGLIIKLQASEGRLLVQKFLTSDQLTRQLPPTHRIEGISFWPKKKTNDQPYYLCDTDVMGEISTEMVTGLAFVFFEAECLAGATRCTAYLLCNLLFLLISHDISTPLLLFLVSFC